MKGDGWPMLTKDQSRGQDETDQINPDVFDRNHLNRYTEGDLAFESELLGLFLGQYTPLRAQLAQANSAQDWKFATHSLKGSARSIGAPQIAQTAERLESMGYSAPVRDREAQLDELDRAHARFLREAQKLGVGPGPSGPL
jgi:HPt (histidine-containing phosphotransfer) domain-containing protein